MPWWLRDTPMYLNIPLAQQQQQQISGGEPEPEEHVQLSTAAVSVLGANCRQLILQLTLLTSASVSSTDPAQRRLVEAQFFEDCMAAYDALVSRGRSFEESALGAMGGSNGGGAAAAVPDRLEAGGMQCSNGGEGYQSAAQRHQRM